MRGERRALREDTNIVAWARRSPGDTQSERVFWIDPDPILEFEPAQDRVQIPHLPGEQVVARGERPGGGRDAEDRRVELHEADLPRGPERIEKDVVGGDDLPRLRAPADVDGDRFGDADVLVFVEREEVR